MAENMNSKILIVDDELNILRALSRLFANEDYEVITAQTGEEAIRILNNRNDIGVLISDMRMIGLSGVEVLESAKMINPDIIRIMLTGYADINAAIGAINRGGAYRYITKPWNDEELLQIVREGLEKLFIVKENKRLTDLLKGQAELLKAQNDELKSWHQKLATIVQKQTVEIVRKNEIFKENFKASIEAFSELIEIRNKSVRNHSRNVAEVSVKIARKSGLSPDEIEAVRVASLLHDIGKIGIADELLQKRFEDMKPREMKEYMQHSVRGQAAIDKIESLRPAGILVRHHHERFNGGGFPDGLRGKDIPIGARIIAVADYVDKAIGKFSGENAVKFTLNKVKEELVRRFDPQLFQYLEEPLLDIYKKIVPEGVLEEELHLADLQEGMIVSRDIFTGSGFPFLNKGVVLNDSIINSIKRYYQIDPSQEGIFIWLNKK